MLVYNIRKEIYANSLAASGVANRWNRAEQFVIYTGSSRALAMLESLVHRNNMILKTVYKVLTISIETEPGDIQEVDSLKLPSNWHSLVHYPMTQELGSAWYRDQKTLILQVPSAIVPQEHNFLINTKHPDFEQKVKIYQVADFDWDRFAIIAY